MLETRIFEPLYNQKNSIIELVSIRFMRSLLDTITENKNLDILWREICRDGMQEPIIIHGNLKNNKLRILDGKKRVQLFENEGIVIAPAYLLLDNRYDDDLGVPYELCIPGVIDTVSKNFEIKTKPSEVITALN